MCDWVVRHRAWHGVNDVGRLVVQDGTTALEMAGRRGHEGVIKQLFLAGTSVSVGTPVR